MPDTETDEAPESVMNPEVTFMVYPERLGRDRAPEPFEVALPEHYRSTADYLAQRIYRHVKPFLLSDNFEVTVNMRKGTFSIEHNRFGRGRFAEKAD